MSSAEARADAFLNKGRACLDAGELAEAESCFRQAARTYTSPTALNNWALCRYLAGDYADALTILQPLLTAGLPLPFTHALASMAHTARGEREQALEQVRAAVRDFDRGFGGGNVTNLGWVEYTITIKRAAGQAGEHRLVLDLHGRWPGRELPDGAFVAGVAAFNLGKFGQAAKYWRRITAREWVRPLEPYVLVADLAEQGLVPPFSLEYEPNAEWEPTDRSPAAAKALVAKGSVRVGILAAALVAPESNAALIDALISETGSWGLDLGRRLLAGSRVSMGVKMGAAKALTEAGVFAPGQPIPIVHEGRQTTVTLQMMRIPDPELDRKVEAALQLRDAGRRDDAYKLLAALEEQGITYPPAMATLANLMRDRGELEAARAKLELADQLMPDNPTVLFNLGAVCLQLRDPETALEVLQRINPEGTTAQFQQSLAGLKNAVLERMGLITNPMVVADSYRAEEEERPVSPNLRLRTALRQEPVEWLNATAHMYRLDHVRRRPERERLLAEALLNPAQVQRLLAKEDAAVRDALRLLLSKGGWVKLQSLTRKYGPLDGDGYWWEERPPQSVVGRLRLLGLLFIGRAQIDGRMHKVAVVPAELRGEVLL